MVEGFGQQVTDYKACPETSRVRGRKTPGGEFEETAGVGACLGV